MLQSIREYIQGWIAIVIISIIIVTFALWGIHSYFIGGAGNQAVIAKVNGTEITKEQLSIAYQRIRRQVQIQYGAKSDLLNKDEGELKSYALQSLIEVEVLKQSSLKQGFQISEKQIESYLQSMPDFQVEGRFSLDRFHEALSSSFLSINAFVDLIRTNLLIGQPKLGLTFSSFSLPDETNYSIDLINQERDIDYLIIPFSHILAQGVTISPEKIQTYYEQHKNEFMTKEAVQVDYIELSLNDFIQKIKPTENALKNFYDENINTYTEAMQWKLASVLIPVRDNTKIQMDSAKKESQRIIQALNQGQSFVEAMGTHSEAFTSKAWMALNQIPQDFQKAVSQLNKINQISKVIKTKEGLVIIRVLDIKKPMTLAYEQVKNKVREAYLQQRAEEKLAEGREQLAELAFEHPDTLQFAAKRMNLPIHTSERFSKEKGGTDISQYPKVRELAFSNDILNLQNNSDVLSITPEKMIVLRINSHVPATRLPLSQVDKQIEENLKNKLVQERAEALAKDILSQLGKGKEMKELASDDHLQWNQAGFIGRYANQVNPAILDMAFRMPKPAAGKAVYDMVRLPDGYGVIALKNIKQGIADNKERDVFAEQVQNSSGLLEYQLYKQSQMHQAKVNLEQQQLSM